MKNQRCERVKVNIFGVFGKHFVQIRKKMFLCFLCSLKTDLKCFREQFCFCMIIIIRKYEQGWVNIQ